MGRFLVGLARWMSIVGGTVLLALIAVTCASVIGRLLNGIGHSDLIATRLAPLGDALQKLGPINGDFEIIEAGVAFAIFSFLPWCMVNRGHARVNVFTSALPRLINQIIGLVWDTLFAAVMIVITWRLSIGMMDKRRYQETTFLLEFPIWMAFAACAAASIIATVVAVYMIYARTREMRGLDSGLPAATGANA